MLPSKFCTAHFQDRIILSTTHVQNRNLLSTGTMTNKPLMFKSLPPSLWSSNHPWHRLAPLQPCRWKGFRLLSSNSSSSLGRRWPPCFLMSKLLHYCLQVATAVPTLQIFHLLYPSTFAGLAVELHQLRHNLFLFCDSSLQERARIHKWQKCKLQYHLI